MNPEIYLFDEMPVRVAMMDEEPWFVANDAARVLGIKDAKSTLRFFPEDEKGVRSMHTLGGPQEMTVLSEPGLYRLIFQSRKAEAERFKKWVFHEVLPSIRRTGCYGVLAAAGAPGLAELKLTLKRAIDAVVAGTMPVAKGNAVAILAQRLLEVHRAEAESYGNDKVVPGLPGGRDGKRLLSPERRGAADALQTVPQHGVPAEGEEVRDLPGAPDGSEAPLGGAAPAAVIRAGNDGGGTGGPDPGAAEGAA